MGYLFHYLFSVLFGVFIILTFLGLWDLLLIWIDWRVVLLVIINFWFAYSNN
jgi:hypothetical protein